MLCDDLLPRLSAAVVGSGSFAAQPSRSPVSRARNDDEGRSYGVSWLFIAGR
eukprot:COSAG02_NODE_733_length_17960_cov_122.222440_4_plen_52_part_00